MRRRVRGPDSSKTWSTSTRHRKRLMLQCPRPAPTGVRLDRYATSAPGLSCRIQAASRVRGEAGVASSEVTASSEVAAATKAAASVVVMVVR